jgi:ATP-dependent RNA helicase DHX29
MGEISGLLTRLSSSSRYNRGHHWLLPLHSSISPAQQQQAFAVPPPGVRKIVLSTNIAETSVTVEDVVAVIDSGRHKERRYDPHRHMSLLVEDWISRAAAMQRRGRAGRVRPGVCYCLYTQHRFESVLRRYQIPEIARVPLEELILQLHLMHLGPAATFLESVLEPPPPKAVASSVAALEEIGALQLVPAPAAGTTTAGSKQTGAAAAAAAAAGGGKAGGGVVEVLTPLGRHLAMLPLDPRLGKLLVLGACLGCLAPALVRHATARQQQNTMIAGDEGTSCTP